MSDLGLTVTYFSNSFSINAASGSSCKACITYRIFSSCSVPLRVRAAKNIKLKQTLSWQYLQNKKVLYGNTNGIFGNFRGLKYITLWNVCNLLLNITPPGYIYIFIKILL